WVMSRGQVVWPRPLSSVLVLLAGQTGSLPDRSSVLDGPHLSPFLAEVLADPGWFTSGAQLEVHRILDLTHERVEILPVALDLRPLVPELDSPASLKLLRRRGRRHWVVLHPVEVPGVDEELVPPLRPPLDDVLHLPPRVDPDTCLHLADPVGVRSFRGLR